MIDSKRIFRRFALPLHVKFRPTYGAKDYSTGATMNVSVEGFALDAHDFRFFVYEHLELIFELSGNEDPVSLYGDVLWKKQNGKRCLAGIKFRMKDLNMQKESIEKIFLASNIPLQRIYRSDSELPTKLGFIKQYYDSGSKCKVTFRLPGDTAQGAQHAMIVGDFNNWNVSESPMIQLETGDFVITLDLDGKRKYRFRYLIDGSRWENDRYADRYVPNDFGGKDSVVIV
jgi:hypothetical protein